MTDVACKKKKKLIANKIHLEYWMKNEEIDLNHPDKKNNNKCQVSFGIFLITLP